jgi:hypothetical protein
MLHDVAGERGAEAETRRAIQSPASSAPKRSMAAVFSNGMNSRAPHETSRRSQRQQVVAGEERFVEDVVGGKRERREQHEQRAPQPVHREARARAEHDDHDDARERQRDAPEAAGRVRLEADGEREGQRRGRRERDDQRRDTGGRRALAGVECEVVDRDPAECGHEDPQRRAPPQARQPAGPPEQECEAGSGHQVAPDRHVRASPRPRGA